MDNHQSDADRGNSLLQKIETITNNWNDNKGIELARMQIASFQGSKPTKVPVTAFSLKSKIPHKTISLREILFMRELDLTTEALTLFERGRHVPAMVLTRAAMESAALLIFLDIQVSDFLQNQENTKLNTFLEKSLLGSRDQSTEREAINILTVINRVDRMHNSYRHMYDQLSEFTHPNSYGTLGSYGNFDYESFTLHLDMAEYQPPLIIGLLPLLITVELFVNHYNTLADKIRELNNFF